ncbi:DNA polymerase III subunit alpha [Candidatus Peregrinibacteria bacterium]|nr:DNA polymerase III subunit alpha [Candidatus Peregrinibacteria bacterium]
MSFVNLHAHSHYSLLDGFGSPKSIIMRSKELGYKAAALTDHGVVHGLIEFFKAGKNEGIKPILGCEIYIAPRTRFDKDPKLDTKPYHLTLLAQNNTGYKNILEIVSKANLEGFYYKPRADYGVLKAHSEGVIALSGCLAGHLPRSVLSGDKKSAEQVIKQHIKIFGKDNYFLEIQNHPLIENQTIVNNALKKYSEKFGLDLVATNDSHYPHPNDSDVHDIMLCIQTGTTVNDPNRMRYAGDYSIRSLDDLQEAFKDFPGAIDNTIKIAEKCNVDFTFGENLIPQYNTPQNESAEIYLRQLCEEGLAARFENKEAPKEYKERLTFELNTVHKMGFDTYFLIVQDFINYAKNQKIVVGPGRGSAAGSIISWSLGITNVDPIKYGLFFERFLNPERVSMPDIDIDFADTRRDEVINYVVEKYGRENVAQIITFGTMAPRAAVRDVGRALGYPYQEVDTLAKTVPMPVLGKHLPLDVSIKDDHSLKDMYENDPRAKTLLDLAIRLEGSVRHSGTHACAVIISEKKLTEYTALQYGSGSKNEIVTQYSAKPLEALGLLKMDFLGLRNLTVIETTSKILKRTQDKEIDIESIPMNDKKTFELFQRGDTTGVFQFESPGMKRYLKELKPTVFEDIVAMGALYRPGPMDWIPSYIKGKHDPESVQYLDDSFKSVLKNTYGVAVYQEQILQLARDFAGFSLGEADILRKAVGKKIPSLLAEQREKFIRGACDLGHKKKFAQEVFKKVIEPFAGYGFNKAHAVCYGLIAYQTAYLKAHYPVEFMSALLSSDATNTDRVVLEIKECNEMGIKILPPSINESLSNFTVVDNDKIRFGLLAVKGIGEGPVRTIIDERKANGPYESLDDFASRVPYKIINKKLIQALSYSGALDEFGNRNQLAESYDEISNFAKSHQETALHGQTNIFGMMDDSEQSASNLKLKSVNLSTPLQNLKWEKDFLGMYVSGHPLRGLTDYISRKAKLIGNIAEKDINKNVKIIGMLSDLKRLTTKTGGSMATFMLEDPTARISAIMFPRDFAKFGNQLENDSVVSIEGKLNHRRDEYQIAVNAVRILSLDVMIANAKERNVYNPKENTGIAVRLLDDILAESAVESSDSDVLTIQIPKNTHARKMKQLNDLLSRNKGKTPVDITILSSNKTIRLPFSVDANASLKTEIKTLLN